MDIVAVIFIRLTHTGVKEDGSPNLSSVTIYDLDESTISKTRERYVPVPVGSTVDIPMSTRTFVSYTKGAICGFVNRGLITAEVHIQLRDKQNKGGPAGAGQTLQAGALNVERVNNVLRLVVPDIVLPGDVNPVDLSSVGFVECEHIDVTGFVNPLRDLNGSYIISSVTPGSGLSGVNPGSYLIEVPSEGADIAAQTVAGVNLCLSQGRISVAFTSSGDVLGLGDDFFGYVGGQLFPTLSGGATPGGTLTVLDEGVALGNSPFTTLNFIGTGVTAADQADPSIADILIPGGIPATNPETSGAPIFTFDVVAYDNNGDVVPAVATTALNLWNVIGISQQAVGAANPVEISEVSGLLQPMRFALAPATGANGSIVFLSTVAGEVTLTPPAASGNTIFRVGILVGADGVTTTPDVHFRPQFISSIS